MEHDKLRVLSRPFTDIKTRPGRNGQELSYIEGHAVVQRLNEAFAGDWSFKVLSHEVQQTEVVVLGELRTGDLYKQAFGGSELTRTRDGKVVSVADDLKAAATDALKKAATLLGVGLHLYGAEQVPDDVAVPTGPRLVHSAPDDPEPPLTVNNRLTRKQAEFIDKLGRNRGLDRAELEELARDRYGRQCAYLTVQQASDFIKLLGKAA
jgi:hypothetical protein